MAERSCVWNFFRAEEERDENDERVRYARCLQTRSDGSRCPARYKCAGGSTSTARKHLADHHAAKYKELLSTEASQTSRKRRLSPLFGRKRPISARSQVSRQSPPSHSAGQAWIQYLLRMLDGKENNSAAFLQLTSIVTEMLACENLSTYYLESPAWRRLVKRMMPHCIIPERRQFVEKYIPEMVVSESLRLKTTIAVDDPISAGLTCERWTSQPTDGDHCGIDYVDLSLSYVTKSFEAKTILLEVMQHPTTEGLEGGAEFDVAAECLSLLARSELNSTTPIFCCVSSGVLDNLRIGVGGVHLLNCVMTAQQAIFREALEKNPSISAIFTNGSAIVDAFLLSEENAMILSAHQQILGLPESQLVRSSPTRPTTELLQEENLLQQRSAVEAALAEIADCHSIVRPRSPEEWRVVQHCVQLMRPFRDFSKALLMKSSQNSRFLSLACVIPLLHLICEALTDRMENKDMPKMARKFGNALQRGLVAAFPDFCTSSRLHRLATACDPRFKAMYDHDIKGLTNEIENFVFDFQRRCTERQDASHSPWSSYVERAKTASQKAWLSKEISSFFGTPVYCCKGPNKDCPLEWWAERNRHTHFPFLASVARSLSFVPATAVSAEKVWDTSETGGLVEIERHMRPDTECMEDLCFLYGSLRHDRRSLAGKEVAFEDLKSFDAGMAGITSAMQCKRVWATS